jgi:choline kinase
MLDKKTFTNLMKELLVLKEDEDNLNEAFKRFEPDFNYISFNRYESLIVKTLELTMEDDSEWIQYFLYERDAEFTNKKIITDKNGKKLPFRSFSDLYDLINNKDV